MPAAGSFSDDQLVVFNNVLGQLRDQQKLDSSGLPADFVKCLESAAPVYRNNWWQEHRKANQEFIAEMEPKVAEFAPVVILIEETMPQFCPPAETKK